MPLSFSFISALLLPYPKDAKENNHDSAIQRAGNFPLFDTNILLDIEKYCNLNIKDIQQFLNYSSDTISSDELIKLVESKYSRNIDRSGWYRDDVYIRTECDTEVLAELIMYSSDLEDELLNMLKNYSGEFNLDKKSLAELDWGIILEFTCARKGKKYPKIVSYILNNKFKYISKQNLAIALSTIFQCEMSEDDAENIFPVNNFEE